MFRCGDLTNGTAGGRVLFANKLLSFGNRRLYRQSRVYTMKIDVDIGSPLAAAGIDVYVLRNTWDLHGAYRQAMAHYYNAMKEELANSAGANTRWHDFRVTSDYQADEIVPVTMRPNSSGTTFSLNRLDNGDFDFSRVVDAGGTERGFTLGIVGGPGNEYSIIDEWEKKDRVHTEPASANTSQPYTDLVENNDEANYDLLRQNGAVPPYNSVADNWLYTKVCTIKEAAGSSKLTSGFFEAPLGIVLLASSGFTGDGVLIGEHPLTVHFQSGDYKGVKAPAYATPVLTESMEYEVV